MDKRLIVGISGASGAPLALRLLQALKELEVETHLVVTEGGERTLTEECGMTLQDLDSLVARRYDIRDLGAAISSGTFAHDGMVVIPCSMKTLAGIHSGYSENLLLRAADVTLKEGRKLVLVPRESPLSPIHLRNLYDLSSWGVRVVLPVLSYYQKPESLTDMEDHILGKLLDQLGLPYRSFRRWEG